MSDGSPKRYLLNKKAFAALRALGVNPEDERWNYIHCSPQGVIATDCTKFIRVTLPQLKEGQPTEARIFPQKEAQEQKQILSDTRREFVEMPEGLPAKSSGQYSVPSFDFAIPKSEAEVTHVTVEAQHLIALLRAACEVTDHAKYLVKLRIVQSGKHRQLRIDAHRDEDGQEFTGVMSCTEYTGLNIPGDKSGDVAPVPMQSEKIDTSKLELPMVEGRKFRR